MPIASHDEIKRAYAELAWKFHPDRLQRGDGETVPPESVASAEWRMEEINEAWATLRTPALRAAYDDVLGSRVVPLPGAGLRRPASVVVDDRLAVPASMASRPTADDGETVGGCGIFLVLSVVLVITVLAIGVVVAVFSSSEPATVEVRTRERFATGTCVLVSPRGSAAQGGGASGAGAPASAGGNDVDVEEVPCTAAEVSGKVAAKVSLPLPCPRDSAAVVFATDNQSICIVRR